MATTSAAGGMMGDWELHEGDALDVLRTLAAGSVDLVLADMPYGTTQNRWDSPIDLQRLWPLLRRVGKPTAAFVLTASQPFTSALVTSNPREFRHEWVWIKNRGSNFANTVREPMKEHESVLVFSRGRWTYNPQMQERSGTGRDRVPYVFTERSRGRQSENWGAFAGQPELQFGSLDRVPSSWQKFNTEVGLHPTQKPVLLFAYLVRTYSNHGDTVLDFCMGSGTTGVACVHEGRRFVGIEREREYFMSAERRLVTAQPGLPLGAA